MGTARIPQVWKARCKPLDEIVAIKILDLERQDPGKLVRRALDALAAWRRPQRRPAPGAQPRCGPPCLAPGAAACPLPLADPARAASAIRRRSGRRPIP